VELAISHWAAPDSSTSGAAVLDDYGRQRLREFLKWHVGFWVRDVPRHQDGSWPTMQTRERLSGERSDLDTLFARADESAIEYITDQLLSGGDFSSPPAPESDVDVEEEVEAG
jgi:hypothetical protein